MSLKSHGDTPINSNDTNYHLGHFFRDTMFKNPDFICQIDAATGKEETRRSVLTRSIHLARCFRRLGYQPGDVLALGGYNHLDLRIPYYAALLNGLPIAGVGPLFNYDEVKNLFKLIEPKIAFCQLEFIDNYRRAVEELGLDTRVVMFDGGNNTMTECIQECDKTESIEDFEIANFDTDKVYAWLVSTSSSTGLPKVAAIKHEPILAKLNFFKPMAVKSQACALNFSVVQWISAFIFAVAYPAMNYTMVQTSAPTTVEHTIDIINQYRPITNGMNTPLMFYDILKHEKPCDLSCFNNIVVSGASIYKGFLVDLKAALRRDAVVIEGYGQTECLGPVLRYAPNGPLGNCGQEMPSVKIKLVDPVTEEIITEPNVTGELWSKGPRFSEYYRNPKETAKILTPDGWCRTGDLLRRDENGYYFFVERLKLLIKYRSYKIIPMELEDIILKYDGVHDVCVTSIPNNIDGEWPVAVVVRSPGSTVTAQEIKDLVANKTSTQLRGGVAFLDKLPMTSTGKVARAKVRLLLIDTAKLE